MSARSANSDEEQARLRATALPLVIHADITTITLDGLFRTAIGCRSLQITPKSLKIIMEYRKDIQILRGMSVIMVVLFHLTITGFESGFLGVDIFFVISGFLMSRLYDPARKIDFFQKRAKRLLPAYFVVVLVTLIVCMALTTPNDFDQVITQSLFAATFTSNIGYWFENSYFDKAAFKPLLNLWSLGVEIQFYLLIPLIHWLISRWKASYFFLLAASLVACFVVVGISPKTSFFMLPLRLWEFLIGYGIAAYVAQRIKGQNSSLPWLSAICLLLLIGIPMMNINGAALGFLNGHPGMHALVVALATGGILAVGLPHQIQGLGIASFFEKMGQYSYSIYLVHFPVIVLFLYQPFSGTNLQPSSVEQTIALIAIIGILSALMYYLIEAPLRTSGLMPRSLLVSICAVLILCPLGVMFQKFKFPAKEMVLYQAWSDRGVYRCGKLIRFVEPGAKSCEITKKLDNPKNRIMLVGNSHADSVKATFAAVAQSRNDSVRFLVGNNPLHEGGVSTEELIQEAEFRKITQIVMHYSPGGVDVSAVQQLATLADKKGIAVSFIMPVPTWREHVPKALWKNLKQHKPLPAMTAQEQLKNTFPLDEALSKIRLENFKIYRVTDIFCRPDCQLSDASGKPFYFDDSHLTLTGGELLKELFSVVLENGKREIK